MSDTQLRSVCGLMKRFIEENRTQVARLRKDIRDAGEAVREARERQPPNLELIAALEQRQRELERDLDNALNSLQVLQEEFGAQCL